MGIKIKSTVRAQVVWGGTTEPSRLVEARSSGRRGKKDKRGFQGDGAQGASRFGILNLFSLIHVSLWHFRERMGLIA